MMKDGDGQGPEDADWLYDIVAAVQKGYIEKVAEALAGKYLHPNARDAEGCTLLQWAALNNRCEVATLLLDAGADVNMTGGLLEETPLMWSIRRKYYGMSFLLVERGANLDQRSRQGYDVVHVACKLGDAKALFLLLHWGCQLNCKDNEGLTPLLWLLKNRSGSTSLGLIRLLLKWGESSLNTDREGGNTAMHILSLDLSLDLHVAFEIAQQQQQCLEMPTHIKNAKGFTPYTQAVQSNNHRMVRFQWDALLFYLCPYHTPTVIAALWIFALLIVVHTHGYAFSIIYFVLSCLFVMRSLLQWCIISERGRASMGAALGFSLCMMASHWLYTPHASYAYRVVCLCALALAFLLCIKFHRTKARIVKKSEGRSDLAMLIILAAPQEGPDDEAEREFKASTDANELAPRPRTRGPVLCSTCLCDKRKATTHCSQCGSCVIGRDYHSFFLNNCVGQGNRRLYTGVAAACMFAFALHVHMYLHEHYQYVCPNVQSRWFLFRFFFTEMCVAWKLPGSALVLWFALTGLVYSYITIHTQLITVIRHATFHNLHLRRYDRTLVTLEELSSSVRSFFLNGDYHVAFSGAKVYHKGGGACPTNGPECLKSLCSIESGFVKDEDEDADTFMLHEQMLLLSQAGRAAEDDDGDEEEVYSEQGASRRAARGGHTHGHEKCCGKEKPTDTTLLPVQESIMERGRF